MGRREVGWYSGAPDCGCACSFKSFIQQHWSLEAGASLPMARCLVHTFKLILTHLRIPHGGANPPPPGFRPNCAFNYCVAAAAPASHLPLCLNHRGPVKLEKVPNGFGVWLFLDFISNFCLY